MKEVFKDPAHLLKLVLLVVAAFWLSKQAVKAINMPQYLFI